MANKGRLQIQVSWHPFDTEIVSVLNHSSNLGDCNNYCCSIKKYNCYNVENGLCSRDNHWDLNKKISKPTFCSFVAWFKGNQIHLQIFILTYN